MLLADVHDVLERAHKRSVTLPADQRARAVRAIVGARLAAAALGLKDTRTLQSWAEGGPIKGPDHDHRLQALYRVVSAVEEVYGPAVAAAFVRGSNPLLDDRAPLIVLADDNPVEAERRVMAAVEALLTT